jgi:hypothetical protein
MAKYTVQTGTPTQKSLCTQRRTLTEIAQLRQNGTGYR